MRSDVKAALVQTLIVSGIDHDSLGERYKSLSDYADAAKRNVTERTQPTDMLVIALVEIANDAPSLQAYAIKSARVLATWADGFYIGLMRTAMAHGYSMACDDLMKEKILL